MPPNNIRAAVRRLLLLKRTILQSGGISPLSQPFDYYRYQQSYVLGRFGLKNTPDCIKILNQATYPFSYDKDCKPLNWGADIEFDGTLESTLKENGRLYLKSSRFVRFRSIDEQVEQIIAALKEKSRKLYGE